MRKILTQAAALACLACAYHSPPPIAPSPVFTRIDNAFLISKPHYSRTDTLEVYIDHKSCVPERGFFLWRREGDTLSVLLVQRNSGEVVMADVHEPLNLEQGLQDLYNMANIPFSNNDIQKILSRAERSCRKNDEEYREKNSDARTA